MLCPCVLIHQLCMVLSQKPGLTAQFDLNRPAVALQALFVLLQSCRPVKAALLLTCFCWLKQSVFAFKCQLNFIHIYLYYIYLHLIHFVDCEKIPT